MRQSDVADLTVRRVPNPTCEVPDCEALATSEVTGRWTVADWFDIWVCEQHVTLAYRFMRHRLVDGQTVQAIEVMYWAR